MTNDNTMSASTEVSGSKRRTGTTSAGGNKKNKLEEIVKPRGYDRGLLIDRIMGVTDCSDHLMFLIKWLDCDEMDILKASEINEQNPEAVIQFYEERCKLQRKINDRVEILNDLLAKRKLEHERMENEKAMEPVVLESTNDTTVVNSNDGGEIEASSTVASTDGDVIMAETSQNEGNDPDHQQQQQQPPQEQQEIAEQPSIDDVPADVVIHQDNENI